MRVDEHRKHAERFVVLDEAHAAHVCGKLVDLIHAVACGVTGVLLLQIGNDVVRRVMYLIPLLVGLDVHAANVMALVEEFLDKVAADESAAAGDEDGLLGHGSGVLISGGIWKKGVEWASVQATQIGSPGSWNEQQATDRSE